VPTTPEKTTNGEVPDMPEKTADGDMAAMPGDTQRPERGKNWQQPNMDSNSESAQFIGGNNAGWNVMVTDGNNLENDIRTKAKINDDTIILILLSCGSLSAGLLFILCYKRRKYRT